MSSETRSNPDDLLARIQRDELETKSARLRLFLGMSAGVGKTFAMLRAAQQRQQEGKRVLIGLVETHGRKDTEEQLKGLPLIPKKKISYKGTEIEEMDLDEILRVRPELVIVDELAHTNAPGSRHSKRYQDVIEILDAGIDVYAAMNVQHLESRKDSVEAITQIPIRETVPDSILERATQIELIDIAPIELLKRLNEGKIYEKDRAARATQNFFQEDKLTALREIALRITAERVDQDLQRFSTGQKSSPWQTNERILVAVSHSPSSETLIRAARRLAYNLEAPWVCAYIDLGLTLSDEDQKQLNQNLSLARELNAEVVSVADTDLAAALNRISRQKNVTHILIGRPTRKWILDFLMGGTLLDRLVRESLDVNVHVLKHDGKSRLDSDFTDWFKRFRVRSRPLQYWNTFWFVAGTTFFGALFEPWIQYRAVGFIFLLAVMGVGLVGGMGPVIFSALLSSLIWNFFFIPPRFTFVIRDPDDVILCLSYFVVALAMGSLAYRIRRHERLLRESEEKTRILYEVLQDIASSFEKTEFLSKVMQRVSDLFDADCGIELCNSQGQLTFETRKAYSLYLEPKDQAVAEWVHQSQKPAGWSTETLSDSKSLYLPLRSGSERLGVFVFRPRKLKTLSQSEKNLLDSIVNQVSSSIERHLAQRQVEDNKRLIQSEKLHQTLLNSISHEMRTPLTTILGWTSALALESNQQKPEVIQSISTQIMQASERLNRVIENLLDMSRLNSGVLGLKKEWNDLTDLVGVILKKLERDLNGWDVKVQIPDDFPMVEIDFQLMEHALSNLILNAVSYSGAAKKLRISAQHSHQKIQIFVDDGGPGIPVESREKIFEKFYRVPGSAPGGTGLGLSIVKGIVEAHGGQIQALESPLKGARFKIELPNTKTPPRLNLEGELS